MMARMGYDAVALGEKDLNFGLEAIVEDSAEYGFNVICANLFPKTAVDGETVTAESPVFPAYRIVERGGVRFGIVAALSPAVKNERIAALKGEVEALNYIIRAPLPVLARVVPEVDAQSDVVILIAHMRKAELDPILEDVSGIDLAILGHSAKAQVTPEPTLIHEVPVYMASHQGQYVGRALLSFDSANRIVEATNEVTLLDNSIPDDPDMKALVTEFEAENRKIQKELFVRQQLKGKAGESTSDVYLGIANCQRCHTDAFDSYIATRHARAYATLSEAFMHRDSGCVPCHSTGYGEKGGFEGVRMQGRMVDLVDVQCEACHGPGAEHSRDGLYRTAAKQSCIKCHTAEQDPDFDFSEAWQKIAH
jgi:hypothetical protein